MGTVHTHTHTNNTQCHPSKVCRGQVRAHRRIQVLGLCMLHASVCLTTHLWAVLVPAHILHPLGVHGTEVCLPHGLVDKCVHEALQGAHVTAAKHLHDLHTHDNKQHKTTQACMRPICWSTANSPCCAALHGMMARASQQFVHSTPHTHTHTHTSHLYHTHLYQYPILVVRC